MLLTNCEISLQLKWSKNFKLAAGTVANQNPRFQINDTKFYVFVVAFATQENIKLIKQLESGFKRTIKWNQYLAKTTSQAQNRYLDNLLDPRFSRSKKTFCFVI